MNIKSIFLLSNILAVTLGAHAMAQNKFLAQPDEPATAPTSCTAPAGMIAVVSGILANDAYLARSEPSSDSDYVFSYFGLETKVFLFKDHMTTQDPATAEICSQLEQGIDSAELQQQFSDAIQSDMLWWSIEANKDLGFQSEHLYVERNLEQVQAVAYISAKHITFVTPEQWVEMNKPNALGYFEVGERHVPIPILSIEGIDTENARAIATGTKDSLDYCINGYEPSWLYMVFHPLGEEYDYREPSEVILIPENQIGLKIDNGVWSGCRVSADDEGFNEFVPYSAESKYKYTANCPALLMDGFEVDASYLPESGGAAGGIGTNFAVLCPQTTQRVLLDSCNAGDSYSCDKYADFVKR